ncbi:MAG: pentapeptide repeat-containing protein [Fibrobacter sp.]|nr:pentapeptide repeat-containing protein [Fibrobacter sp.]
MGKLLKIVVLSLLMEISGVFSEELKMYLCLDEMMAQAKPGENAMSNKLVYGYIDGKKTECMSEYEFRAKFFRDEFTKDNPSYEDSVSITKRQKRHGGKGSVKKDLKSADLRGADFKGADLSGADLREANLGSADFRNANLTNANLAGANLEYAYFKGANLTNADLTGAVFKGTYLHLANLTGAKGFDMEQLRRTETVYNAILDPELEEIAKKESPNRFIDPGSYWKCNYYSDPDSVLPKEKRAKRRSFK